MKRLNQKRVVGSIETRLHNNETADSMRRSQGLQSFDVGDSRRVGARRDHRVARWVSDDVDMGVAEPHDRCSSATTASASATFAAKARVPNGPPRSAVRLSGAAMA